MSERVNYALVNLPVSVGLICMWMTKGLVRWYRQVPRRPDKPHLQLDPWAAMSSYSAARATSVG